MPYAQTAWSCAILLPTCPRAAAEPTELVEPRLAERADADAVVRPMVLDQPPQRLDRAGGLDVDVEADLGERIEQFGERRNGLAPVDTGRDQVGVPQGDDGS